MVLFKRIKFIRYPFEALEMSYGLIFIIHEVAVLILSVGSYLSNSNLGLKLDVLEGLTLDMRFLGTLL